MLWLRVCENCAPIKIHSSSADSATRVTDEREGVISFYEDLLNGVWKVLSPENQTMCEDPSTSLLFGIRRSKLEHLKHSLDIVHLAVREANKSCHGV